MNVVCGHYLIDKGIQYDYYGLLILASTFYQTFQHQITKKIYIVREEHVRSFKKERL